MESTFGSRLKALREAAWLTQKDIGDAVGTTSTTVSNWERDVQFPEPRSLRAIAKRLGTSTAYLRKGVEGGEQAAIPQTQLNDIARQIKQLQDQLEQLGQQLSTLGSGPRPESASDDPLAKPRSNA